MTTNTMMNVQSPKLFSDPYVALNHWAAERPNDEGMVFPLPGKRLSFAQWLVESQKLGSALQGLGVKRGDAVAIWAENRYEWLVSQVALAAIGAVMVPINTHFRENDVSYVLARGDVVAILLSTKFRANKYLNMVQSQRANLPSLKHVISFDSFDDHLTNQGVLSYQELLESSLLPLAESSLGPREVASIQFTSGTTGNPKGAQLCYEGMMMNSYATAVRLGLSPQDKWTSIIPLFHCAGCIMNVMGCLSAGATYVGVPAFDAEKMLQIIQQERCTALTGVPTSYLAMLDHPSRASYDLSTLRTGTCGGADCDPTILERCAEQFPMPGLVQVYGQTESSTLIALDCPDSPARWATAGLPLPGMEVRITDPNNGEPVGVDTVGQIEIRGPMVMLGYHNQPEETARAISKDGWMQSGDLGYLRADGRVAIAGGRLRDMIIRGGENIYPVEIENLLRQHPAVVEIAVFGVPDRYYGEVVAAAVQLRSSATAADLQAFCHGKIAKFKHPVKFYQVNEWPLTSSGKIKKRDLQQAVKETGLEELL
ncbi:AMP-binding protein [Neopusillimonas maritima]|nr:AMP-binding protein [Neopusillimonas maritima]|tara:strand:- start:274 stop:1893 length:1620 start_codon:yes stop_codon:yes gene_type:complete